MPVLLNPFTGRLQLVPPAGSPGGGNVTGPGSSTANDIAVFADTTGTVLADSGVPIVSGQLQPGNGTVAAPTYSFSASPGTGMYSSGSNTADLAANGSHVYTATNAYFEVIQNFRTEQGYQLQGVTTQTGSYAAQSTDNVIYMNQSGAVNVTLPASPIDGQFYYVKDISGNASTNNITIVGNGHNVDGAATHVINQNYAAVILHYSAANTAWFIL